MEGLLEFAKGPLFRFSFAILLLGLARVFILSIINGLETKKKAKDLNIPKKYVRKLTWGFLIPVRSLRVKPIFSLVSILFHIGLIITPIFLFDHALLFENSIGISWLGFTLSKEAADILTIITIAAGALLFIFRLANRNARFISRAQDFLWPLILIVPFATGLVCAQFSVEPTTYNAFMLIHILSGCLIFILIPFTKIAHCVLMPISQWVTARAWKFPPEAGEDIAVTLGKEGEKL